MNPECIPMCRVCMQKCPEFVDFDMPLQNENEEDTSITYLDFFFECTRIEVEPHEGGLQCFCLPCGDELSSFYKFVKIAQLTDNLLKAKAKEIPFNINSSNDNIIKSTSHYVCTHIVYETEENINEPEENTLSVLEKTHKIKSRSDDETNDQKLVKRNRLVKLRVEPLPKIESEFIQIDSNHVALNNRRKIFKTKGKKGPATCAFCHEILNNQKLLDKHLIEEHQRRTKPCEICGKLVIRMRDHLLIHERQQQRIQRPKAQCPICYRMISKQTISRHIRHVHQRELKKYECSECYQTFPDAHKLKIHTLKGHNSSRTNIKCLLCTRTFATEISLSNHLRVHTCLERLPRK